MREKNTQHTPAEFAQLKTFLGSKGVATADVAALLGNSPGNRSRLDIERQLTAWLKTRPKA